MRVRTSRGFAYSYNPFDNSIVEGEVADIQGLHIHFRPLDAISKLPNVSAYTIGITEQCNFRCSYCCYSGRYKEHRHHSPRRLSLNEIRPVLDFMVEHSCQDVIIVDFYGGECLLEFDWIRSFVDAAKTITSKRWQYEISTNGSLLGSAVADWLVDNEFRIFVSIDGIDDSHDCCRKDANGRNTFSVVSDNLKYIRSKHESYWRDKVIIMMTVCDIATLPMIAERWVFHPLFRDKMPYRISEVSAIYDSSSAKIDPAAELNRYLPLVEWYKSHPDNGLMKAFFDIWLAEWINRPIIAIDEDVEYPTCIPYNQKLYIDAYGNIGLCERISDQIRIGSLVDGVDYSKATDVAMSTASFVERNCSECEIARVCDICPDLLKLSDDVVSTYCHNQRVYQSIKLRCFCELAEAELI